MTPDTPEPNKHADGGRWAGRIGRKPQVGDRIIGYSLYGGPENLIIRESYDVVIWFDGDDPIHVGVGLTDFGYNPESPGFRLLRKAATDFWEDVHGTYDTYFEARNECLKLRRKLSTL